MDPTYFTISACNRCRKRKARCDASLPACLHCRNSDAICEYIDPHTKEQCPRSHIIDLEHQLSRLEFEVQELKQQHIGKDFFDPAVSSRSAVGRSSDEHDAQPDFIRFESGGDGHYLGASSGLHLARSVLQSARRHGTAFENQTQHESDAPTIRENDRNQYPFEKEDIPLPSWDKTEALVEIFFRQFEIQYPILVQHNFVEDIRALYSSMEQGQEIDCWSNFMLRIVLSTSFHLISQDTTESTRLAERFRHSAIADLNNVMRIKNHRTLQCLLLLLLSSILNSRSAPMWYISGICMRMCVDLGYHTEHTIAYTTHSMSAVEVDTKRRLFWVAYSFDRSLAAILGRPFFIDDEKIDVRLPGVSVSERIRAPALHWLKMKRIESELVRRLLPVPKKLESASIPSNSIPADWRSQMDSKLSRWLDASNDLEPCEDISKDIWEYCYANARLILHRPMSIRPVYTTESLSAAYKSAMTIIHLSFIRAHKSSLELTWLDLHCHLVSGIALLFLVLKSQEAKSMALKHWVYFKSCVIEWQTVLCMFATRWDSIARTKDILSRLADETLESLQETASGNRSRPSGEKLLQPGTEKPPPEMSKSRLASDSTRGVAPSQKHNVYGHVQAASVRGTGRNSQTSPNHHGSAPESLDERHETDEYYNQSSEAPTNFRKGQQGCGSEALFDNVDFASILDGDFWADLEQFDIPLQPHFDSFPYQTGFDPLGPLVMGGMGERFDPTLTDSVLNFQDGFGDDEMEI